MKSKLIEASDAYYNNSTSIMSDEEFDNLKDQFARLYPEDEFLKSIGASVDNSHWEKGKHNIAMTSLNKCNEVSEFEKWVNSTNVDDFVLTTKLDGISLNLQYVNGKLEQAITRGDGITGENILRNVIKMKNVKKSLGNFTGNLRGEVVLKQTDFESLNKKLMNAGEKLMSNPRNAASGIAKRLDSTNSEYLTVLYYFITGDFKYETEKFKQIEKFGLETSYWKKVDRQSAIEEYNEFENTKRIEYGIDIDGLVISVNELNIQNRLGFVNNNPKYSIAWKFGAMKGITKLRDIEFSNGNQKVITPVLIFDTIRLGTNISRCTMSNIDLFLKANLSNGDEVEIAKFNDVIPGFVRVVKKSGNKPFEYPKTCPTCGEPTTIKGKFLYCLNEECQSNIIGSLNKYIEKTEMLGISESTLVKLYEADLVKSPADLYRLNEDDILKLEGFAVKSAKKVIEIINSKKELTLPIFIGSLNIPQFSSSMTEILIENGYNTLEAILNITKEQLIRLKGIEEKTAVAFLSGISKKKQLIADLLNVGITIINKSIVTSNVIGGKMQNEIVVFTGAIQRIDSNGDRWTRKMLQQLVYDNGGSCADDIKNGVTLLVQADQNSTSSKSKKANSLGIKIVSEENFFKLLGM
jgi:DNA ligase (NAD+)